VERQPHPPAGSRTGAPAVTTDDDHYDDESLYCVKRSVVDFEAIFLEGNGSG
jgi:hypothetical protein